MRAEFLKLRKRDFVDAARALGAGKGQIIFRHILPNAMGPVITFSPFIISGEIVLLANLDYLGLGLRAPTPSWGELLSQAKNYFTVAWWLAIYPSLALFMTLTCLNLIGESIRDAFDPKKAI
jgi:microcin C transport system permease protein